VANNAWKNEKKRIKEREYEEERERQQNERHERLEALWNVPDRAKESYLNMEDYMSAETVLEFVKAMMIQDFEVPEE
jgi:deoxyinosine 3'endonuclease (endonuclease V)